MMLNPASAAMRPGIEEDDEDQRERARLQSEMKLLGIDNFGSPVLHAGAVPGPSRAVSNRSPNQKHRLSGSSFQGVGSPRPPSLPPKDEPMMVNEREKRLEAEQGRPSVLAELAPPASPGGASLLRNGSVRVSGHRKRPSVKDREAALGGTGLSSIGLGLSYSKDSTSTWSTRSPSANSTSDVDKDTHEAEKRSSGGSINEIEMGQKP